MSRRQVSEAVGRTGSWFPTIVENGSDSRLSSVSSVASVCGYTIAAVPIGSDLPEGSLVVDSGAREVLERRKADLQAALDSIDSTLETISGM